MLTLTATAQGQPGSVDLNYNSVSSIPLKNATSFDLGISCLLVNILLLKKKYIQIPEFEYNL